MTRTDTPEISTVEEKVKNKKNSSAHLTGELVKLASPSNEQRPDHLQGLDPLFPIPTSSSCAQGGVHLTQLLLQASSREYCHLFS